MQRGVVVTLADGQVETHRTVGENLLQVNVIYNDGTKDGSIMHFGHGLYLRSVVPIEDGVMKLGDTENYAEDSTIRKWSAPSPSSTWANRAPDGGTARSGAVTSVQLAGCTYAAYTVDLTFNDDPNYTERYTYLPDLGIGLLVESVLEGDKETYEYVSIAKN